MPKGRGATKGVVRVSMPKGMKRAMDRAAKEVAHKSTTGTKSEAKN